MIKVDYFFFSSRRRHTRLQGDWSSDVCSSDLSNTAPASALQQASRIGESKSRRLFGKGLVASQVALSLVLVSSAGLFVGYLSHLRNLNLGFEHNNLLLVTLDFAHSSHNAAPFSRLSQELVMRLNAIPGVSSATFSDMSPMEGP